jgi:hypothetical protein
LSVQHPITFLGIEIQKKANGDVVCNQSKFVESLLLKYNIKPESKGNSSVQIDRTPEEPDIPDARILKKLQGFSGEFNWLATRTRVDLSYYVSILASACTKFATWSLALATKILRFLASTKHQGIVITAAGDLCELIAWTDAGFAGADTKSQTGVVISWGGSIITWRSSRQSVSALSTAEAELNAATLGWQILEGLRLLIRDFGIVLPTITVMIDNQAALTIAKCGTNWRTRYFGVRAHRLHEEHEIGRARLSHCPTKVMLADALTKLSPAPVIQVLHDYMQGHSTIVSKQHGLPVCKTSTTPGRALSSDEAGDGPTFTSRKVRFHGHACKHKKPNNYSMCHRMLLLTCFFIFPVEAKINSFSSENLVAQEQLGQVDTMPSHSKLK